MADIVPSLANMPAPPPGEAPKVHTGRRQSRVHSPPRTMQTLGGLNSGSGAFAGVVPGLGDGPTQRKTGKAMVSTSTPRQLNPERLKRGLDRDAAIDKELVAFHGESVKPGKDFLLAKLEDSKAPIKGKGMNTAGTKPKLESQIFAEPAPNKMPTQRVRPDYTEAELARLNPVDDRKDALATEMTKQPTLVDKMYMCQYPMPHKQESYVPAKKRFLDKLPPAPEEVGVQGFQGMGQLSKPIKYSSKANKVIDPFVPENPVSKARKPHYGGRRESGWNIISNQPPNANGL